MAVEKKQEVATQNTQVAASAKVTVKSLFERAEVKQKFQELLGKKSAAFMTTVLQLSTQKEMIDVEPMSVYQSAAVAATLDLPVNPNLGFAYILAYNQKQADGSYRKVAQFQLGYKGLIQLAQRSGQFKNLGESPIFEGQLVSQNPLTGFEFDFTKKLSDKVIGYAAYFSLLNGFEKTLFIPADEMHAHGKKYSQTFKKGYGLWKDDFDAMARKTALKQLLSKYAPLSVEMQAAVQADQAVINDVETMDVSYVDNDQPVVIDKEAERLRLMVDDAKTVEDLDNLVSQMGSSLSPEEFDMIEEKRSKLKK